RVQRRDPSTLYALLWLAIPFVFFSLNQSKRPQYVLPLMPAIALLVAKLWSEARTRAAAIVVIGFGVLLLAAIPFLGHAKMKPENADVAAPTAVALGIAYLGGGLLALFSTRRETGLAALR